MCVLQVLCDNCDIRCTEVTRLCRKRFVAWRRESFFDVFILRETKRDRRDVSRKRNPRDHCQCDRDESSRFFGMNRSKGGNDAIYVRKIVITEAGLKTRGSIRPCEARSSISIVVSGSRRCLLYSRYLILLVQVM